MSVRLVILGLLQEKELHGYELKKIITDHMDDWTSIAFGSIYFALKKLSAEGLIKKVSEERDGNRPSRSIYRISGEGKQEFTKLLRKLWTETQRTNFSFDIALFFISALPIEEIKQYLKEKIIHMEKSYTYLIDHKEEHKGSKYVPSIAFSIMDHSLAHLKAELDWLKALQMKIEKGEVP
jgi:DNA-binding PadR family transcriptional regulator